MTRPEELDARGRRLRAALAVLAAVGSGGGRHRAAEGWTKVQWAEALRRGYEKPMALGDSDSVSNPKQAALDAISRAQIDLERAVRGNR